ncbi:MAG: glycosyltransferase family 4 protein [Chryseolinea sp.]
MASKPRVIIIENGRDITGGLISVMRSSLLLREYFDFTFILPKHSLGKPFLHSKGFNVLELGMLEIRKDLFSLLIYFPMLLINTIKTFRIVNELSADLIVSNDLYNLLPSAYKLFGGRVPYVVYVRFLPSKFSNGLVHFWSFWHLRLAASTIAVSNRVKTELPYQSSVFHIPEQIPEISIDYSPSNSRIILYMSNYIEGKGHEYALRSFAMIAQKHPDWKLRFVGGDMGLAKNQLYKQKLITESQKLSIASQVEWKSFQTDVFAEYKHCALLLNFSESESFSLTCLEAMYAGRPVIATRCGGPEEIIDDGLTGMLVNLRDVNGMADSIEFLISHPQQRENMGMKAYRGVRDKFSSKRTTRMLLDLYQSSLLK